MRDSETGEPLDDGTHIIYVNAAYNKPDDNSDIAKLMHDFRCSKADSMNFDLMAERTKYFKETNEGVRFMCRINEEMVNDAKKEALISVAQQLISMGMSIEDIAKATELSIEEVQTLANKSRTPKKE